MQRGWHQSALGAEWGQCHPLRAVCGTSCLLGQVLSASSRSNCVLCRLCQHITHQDTIFTLGIVISSPGLLQNFTYFSAAAKFQELGGKECFSSVSCKLCSTSKPLAAEDWTNGFPFWSLMYLISIITEGTQSSDGCLVGAQWIFVAEWTCSMKSPPDAHFSITPQMFKQWLCWW